MKRSILLFVSVMLLSLASGGSMKVQGAKNELGSGSLSDNENITWFISDDGELNVSGEGAMPDYTASGMSPWYSYRSSITSLMVSGMISHIGNYAFSSLAQLQSVQFSLQTAADIGSKAFMGCSALTQITIMYEQPLTANSQTFKGVTTSTIKLYVPDAMLSYYMSESVWNDMQVLDSEEAGHGSGNNPDNPIQGDTYYTVYWSVNGSIQSTTSVDGTGVINEMPETPTACDAYGYMFAGWTDEPINGSQSGPPATLYYDTNDFPGVSHDITYYAVFNSVGATGSGTYEVVDELTCATTGVQSNSNTYSDWSGITVNSMAVYAGNSAGGNNAIQLRSNNNNSGVVTTATGGIATKITVEWQSNTSSGRTLNVYGKSTPYSAASDLYNGNEGTLIGTVAYDGTSTTSELNLSGEYEYVGLRSASGALYLSRISIIWSTSGAGGTIEYVTTCGNSGGNIGGDDTGGTVSDNLSGELPNGKTWEILNGNTLYIAGGGDIAGFEAPDEAPWYNHRNEITSLYLNADFFSIGNYIFYALPNLTGITCMSSYVPTLQSNTFSQGRLEMMKLFIRQSLYNEYMNAPYWQQMQIEPFSDGGTGGEVITGALDNGLIWEFDSDKRLLTVSGSGQMLDFALDYDVPWYEYTDRIDSIIVGEGVTYIGNNAFVACANLTKATFPRTTDSIGVNIFSNHNQPFTLNMGAFIPPAITTETFGDVAGQLYIYVWQSLWGLYANTPIWEHLMINSNEDPSDIEAMDVIDNQITWYINDDTLRFLGSGVIPNYTDASDQPWAEYRGQITSVQIDGAISTIGQYAFAECSSLKTITLSSATNILEYMCFDDCTLLSRIVAPYNDVMPSAEVAFGSTPYTGITLAVPANLVENYQSAMFWYEFNVVAIDGGNEPVTEDKIIASGNDIGPSASWELYESGLLVIKGSSYIYGYSYYEYIPWYEYRAQINTVQVEEGIQSLTKAAFFDCTQMTSISLPASLCCIDDSTFYNCVALHAIDCRRENPPSVNGVYPFGDLNLTGITLTVPEGSGTLYEYADYWGQMQVVEKGGSTSQLEPYQLEYIFVNSVGISGFDPNLYNYAVTLPAGSGTPHLSYMSGNNSQTVEVEQPTSPNSAGYLHVSVDGVRMATYTVNFSCESVEEQVAIPLTHDWTFIMLPGVFNGGSLPASAVTSDGEVEWGTYSGTKRAEGRSGWEQYDLAGEYFHYYQAYIVRAKGNSATLTITLPAGANDSIEATLPLSLYAASHEQNANWNFVGNPYNKGYNIAGLAAIGIESPITVWNGTGYVTYTPGIDPYTLQPFEAFFIQLPEDGQTSLQFLPEYRVNVDGSNFSSDPHLNPEGGGE